MYELIFLPFILFFWQNLHDILLKRGPQAHFFVLLLLLLPFLVRYDQSRLPPTWVAEGFTCLFFFTFVYEFGVLFVFCSVYVFFCEFGLVYLLRVV